MLLVFVLPLSLYGQTSLKSIKTSLKCTAINPISYSSNSEGSEPTADPFHLLLVTASFLALVSQDLPSFLQVDGSLSICVNSL